MKRTGRGRCLIEGLTIKVEEVSYVDKSSSEETLNLMDDGRFVSIRTAKNLTANILIERREK